MDTMVRAPAIGLLFVALICALLVALAASRRGARRVLGVTLAAMLIGASAFAVVMSARMAGIARVGTSTLGGARVGGPAWPLVVEEAPPGSESNLAPPPLSIEFPASIYPSARTAVRSLAGAVARSAQAAAGGEGPVEIKAYSKDQKRLLLELIEIVQRELPAPKVAVHDLGKAEDAPQPEPGSVVLYLWVDQEVGTDDPQRFEYMLTPTDDPNIIQQRVVAKTPAVEAVHVRVMGTDRRVEHAASVVDKPWADDFAAYVTRDPKHAWILAQSAAATSADEAEADALRVAAVKLEPLVRDRGRSRGGPWNWTETISSTGLQEQIFTALRTGRPELPGTARVVQDRFVQRFDRPYGQIWQASLLINASPLVVGELARMINSTYVAQHRTWRQTFASLAGVIVLILLVYAFLNVATKGYFTWPLRAATAALIAAVVLFVVFAWG